MKSIQNITIEASINASIKKVWKYYTLPAYISKWNYASDKWHTPKAENDLRIGVKFKYRMEAKDGSAGFDFEGEYTQIKQNELIEYVILDGRKVKTKFIDEKNKVRVETTFEVESENSIGKQKEGWQAILDNFKKYVEEN